MFTIHRYSLTITKDVRVIFTFEKVRKNLKNVNNKANLNLSSSSPK